MKVKKLHELLNSRKKVLLVDVREKDEYKKSKKRVKGAKNVPMGKVFVMAGKGTLPKNTQIVTICKTGGRCGIVAKELKKKGFKIEALEGGVQEWDKQKV